MTDWCKYFNTIKPVCPWSYSAYKKQEIHITNWRSHILELDSYQARIYIAKHHKPRQLKKMSDRFNREREWEEWLWSHPDFGFNSAPVACFIQQDRATLDKIRTQINQIRPK